MIPMAFMSKQTRRWRMAANQAMASEHYAAERERLLAALLSKAGQGHLAGTSKEVRQAITERWLRASLAARYMDTLFEHRQQADYEDVRRLGAEVDWTLRYLLPMMQGASLAAQQSFLSVPREPVGRWFSERMISALAAELPLPMALHSAA